jgi:hypothetical protein
MSEPRKEVERFAHCVRSLLAARKNLDRLTYAGLKERHGAASEADATRYRMGVAVLEHRVPHAAARVSDSAEGADAFPGMDPLAFASSRATTALVTSEGRLLRRSLIVGTEVGARRVVMQHRTSCTAHACRLVTSRPSSAPPSCPSVVKRAFRHCPLPCTGPLRSVGGSCTTLSTTCRPRREGQRCG